MEVEGTSGLAVADVGAWLAQLGLAQYAQAFDDNGVDAQVLGQLTAGDLKELGVSRVGHRRKLLTAIEGLRARPLEQRHEGEQSAEEAQGGPERRYLTVLFCDLAGSTALSERLDPEDLREVMRSYYSVVAEVVGAQAGFVAQYLGDGAIVYFGYPIAHEDDAERAVRTALSLCENVRKISAHGRPLEVRVGIATGLVVVGDRPESHTAPGARVTGETPNLAARLQGMAEPGGIVIDTPTRRLVGRLFEVVDRGPITLKGFEKPVQTWSVVGEGAAENRFEALRSGESPLVGRDEELGQLERRWRQAKARTGRLVMISGEPGIGKSRLVSAFRDRIAQERPIELRYFCSPQHGSTALHPVIIQLTRAAGFDLDDTEEEKRRKLEQLAVPTDDLPFIADLLSVPVGADAMLDELAPQEKRQKLFGVLLRKIEALAEGDPLILLFEDVHWIDPTTQELLDLLIARIARLPILILLTFRPSFSPQWVGQPHATVLSLSRLGDIDRGSLIRALGRNALSRDVIAEIADRTDGIPLFAEELTKAVLESGGAGLLEAASHALMNVPATLHASLMARLDHLGGQAREVAQVGAAIGREFSHDLLSRVARDSHALLNVNGGLRALVDAGLVFVRGTPPDAIYTFKHALVQDAAYSTLLHTRRRNLHAVIAKELEAETTLAPETLAHHLRQAGNDDAAAREWFRAGQLANEQSANLEAVRSFREALSCLDRVVESRDRDRLRLDVYGALCHAVFAAGWIKSEAVRVMDEAEALSRKLRLPTPAEVTVHRWQDVWSKSDPRRSLKYARALRRDRDPAVSRIGYRLTAQTHGTLGRPLVAVINMLNLAISGYNRVDAKQRFDFVYEPLCAGLNNLAWYKLLAGYLDQAVEHESAALNHAKEFTHPQTDGNILLWSAIRHRRMHDFEGMKRFADLSHQVGAQHNLPQWCLWADFYRALWTAQNGDCFQALDLIDQSFRGLGPVTFSKGGLLQIKADVLLIAGDAAASKAALTEASSCASAVNR